MKILLLILSLILVSCGTEESGQVARFTPYDGDIILYKMYVSSECDEEDLKFDYVVYNEDDGQTYWVFNLYDASEHSGEYQEWTREERVPSYADPIAKFIAVKTYKPSGDCADLTVEIYVNGVLYSSVTTDYLGGGPLVAEVIYSEFR